MDSKETEARTITVTGIGMMDVQPDNVRIRAVAEGRCEERDTAVEKLGRLVTQINGTLSDLGLGKGSVTNDGLYVEPVVERVKVNGNWTDKKDGFRFGLNTTVIFPTDMELLSRAVAGLNGIGKLKDIRFDFVKMDFEKTRIECLGLAGRNARDKAEAIAVSLGAKLGKVISARETGNYRSYYDNSDACYSRKSSRMEICCEDYEGYEDIQAEDIAVSRTVTVTWEVEY